MIILELRVISISLLLIKWDRETQLWYSVFISANIRSITSLSERKMEKIFTFMRKIWFQLWDGKLKKKKLVVIVDCCHPSSIWPSSTTHKRQGSFHKSKYVWNIFTSKFILYSHNKYIVLCAKTKKHYVCQCRKIRACYGCTSHLQT